MQPVKRNSAIIIAVIAAVAAAVAVVALKSGNGKDIPLSKNNDTAKTDSVAEAKARKVRPEYEFGKPVDLLSERSPMAAAMVEGGSDNAGDEKIDEENANPGNDGAKAIETRVNTTRRQFEELKKVYEQYKQMPTQALRDKGNKLKEQVLTGVSGLMPLARRYNYRAGIDEAQAMRRQALEMNFK